jgi:hypothetical protein
MSIAATTARQVTLATGKNKDKTPLSLAFLIALWFSLFFGVVVLVALIVNTAIDGSNRFDSVPRRRASAPASSAACG